MKISIKGPIISNGEQWIYDWFGIEAVSPSKVSKQLNEAKNADVEVEINSGGGSVFDASEIYTALRDYSGSVTTKIVGIAASAASVIAMAADKLMMSPTSQMMIHNASTRAEGDYRDMDQASGFLKNVNQTIANAYSLKSGKSYDELLSMMDAETWLTPQQALEHGLIDEIMFEAQGVKVVASADEGTIPQKVIDRIRAELNSKGPKNQIDNPQVVSQEDTVKKKEDEVVMNLEELKNNHPELYKQVKDEGYEQGVKAENNRIKAVEDVAIVGYEELVNKAKFETMDSAEKLAMNIIKVQKEQGETFLNNRKEDAQSLDNIKGSAAPENGAKSETVEASEKGKSIADIINKMRGGNK